MIFKLCDLNKARFNQIKKILSLIFELLSTTFIQTSEHSKINKIIRNFFYKTMLFKLDHFQALFLDGIQKHKLSRTHFLSQKWQNKKQSLQKIRLEQILVGAYKAAAPEMISMSSPVMTACLVLL